MDVVTGWRDVPAQAKGAVLAIGNFDGVHRGHQAVLGRARDLALAAGKRSGAVVFEPHPREFFAPDQPFFRLTPLPVKLELLEALGLDETFVIEFGPELAGLSAETFASEVVAKGLGAAHVVVGYDFTYGKGRTYFTPLGHTTIMYTDQRWTQHLLAAVQYILGDLEADATPSAKPPAKGTKSGK